MVEADGALERLYPSLRLPIQELTALALVLLAMLFYLFPDGRFVPRWTRFPAVVLAVVAFVDPILPIRGQVIPSGQFSELVLLMLLGSLAVGFFAQVYRYRRVSTPNQRQQTKWVVFGMLSLLIPILLWSLLVEVFPFQSGNARLIFNTAGFGMMWPIIMIFPISIVVSILRYRLWDIDLVINRALVYGVLTVTLVGAYFGGVVLLQMAFRGVTDQGGSVAIVISTLAISALFMPLRRGVQNTIDRRFYRRKYDAALTLEAFSNKMRDEVDLEQLGDQLITIITSTMQPAHVSLWLSSTGKDR